MKPKELVGDIIGNFKLEKYLGTEQKTIDNGRGSYQTLTYLSSLPDATSVWVVVFLKSQGHIRNWRTFLPDYDGNERLEKRMKDYKFLHAANLSSFFPDNPIVPKVYGLGEDVVKTTVPQAHGSVATWKIHDENFIYLVKEPLERVHAPLSQEQAVDLTIKLAHGLQDLHKQSIYHSKIQPHNVVGTVESPKLTNFDESSHSIGLTVMTAFGGSEDEYLNLLCMPWEMIVESESITPMSEVYSLATTLYYLKEGLPAPDNHISRIVRNKCTQERFPELHWSPGTNPDLINVINKATEKDPTKRHQSMAEFAKDLERV